MRHGLVSCRVGCMPLLVVHVISVGYLAGLSWVVQLVVYPSFRLVGPTDAWGPFHTAHSRRLALSVGPAWAVQGTTLAILLVDRPGGVPLALVLAAAALGAVTVADTVLRAVPLHEALTAYDDVLARRLIVVHRRRTAAWTCAVVVAGAMVLAAS